jgi:hypothetical protein
MESIENILLRFIVNNNSNANNHQFFDYEDIEDSDEIEISKLNVIDIGLNTKYMKNLITYNDLVNGLVQLQQNKFPGKIKNIIDITNNYNAYNFYCLDTYDETYNNILYDIKNYYICEITEENKKFFLCFVDKKKIKPKSKYAMIFNCKNVYLICLKNNMNTIMTQLEQNIELTGTPDNIIDSDEFIDELVNYAANSNIQISNLTEQITNISTNLKVNMINSFILKTVNTNTKKYNKYIEDLDNHVANLDKNKIYICKTTINTFYFISLLFEKFNFPYNTMMLPIQNSIIILTPNINLYTYSPKNFSGIVKTKTNILFEKIFDRKKKMTECCICFNKSKKNNICFECYQFNGCIGCGIKMTKANMFECVLCKS